MAKKNKPGWLPGIVVLERKSDSESPRHWLCPANPTFVNNE
jgi:hypothetical protein